MARIQDAKDPSVPNGTWDVSADDELLCNLWEQGAYWRYYNIFTARDILQAPEVIFLGARVDLDGAPWGWCYVGVPVQLRDSDNNLTEMPRGYVFTAYVTPGAHLFDWGLEIADPREPYLPEIHDRHRFPGGIAWRNES